MINASVYVEVMRSERLGIVCTISDTHSNVEDVHNDLEVMVYNENKSGKSELIGKIRVPLLRVGYPLHTTSLLLTLSLLSFPSLFLSFLSPLPLSPPSLPTSPSPSPPHTAGEWRNQDVCPKGQTLATECKGCGVSGV